MRMIAPGVMVLEMAIDTLNGSTVNMELSPRMDIMRSQLKELHELEDVRVQQLGATGISRDVEVGYLLGLQAARILLASNPTAVAAKVCL